MRKRRELQRARPYHVKVVVPIRQPNSNGFPGGLEADTLGEIEERLSGELEAEGDAILVGVLTSDAMREFVVYAKSPDAVREKLAQLANATQTHELQFAIQEDPDWDVYKQFVR